MQSERSFILVVVGLAFEARLLRNRKDAAVYCHRATQVEETIEDRLSNTACRGAISFGIAGGLDRHLATGSHIVASEILTEDGLIATDLGWSRRLVAATEHAKYARILGRDEAVLCPEEKRHLFESTGALAVDTESHIVAMSARKRSLPFVCLRVITDAAHRRIPEAALLGLHPDGRANPFGVVHGLMRRPRDVPALVLVARDAWQARRSLLSAVAQIGEDLCLPASASNPSLAPLEVAGGALIASTP
jgi:hopanoid-associated phosphorylase